MNSNKNQANITNERFDLEAFSYELPEERIAQTPAEKRDGSKLLVLDRKTGQTTLAEFRSLLDHLPENCLLVANNSKVLPARIIGKKPTGGKAEFLLLTPLATIKESTRTTGWIQAEAKGLLRTSGRVRPGDQVEFTPEMNLEVKEKQEFGQIKALLHWKGELASHFIKNGHMPLPPYIKREDTREDGERYQTVFADNSKLGSVAAPTAGLHFTEELKQELELSNRSWAEVTLYVGYGTFSPVRVQDIRDHVMHAEYVDVPRETVDKIQEAKKQGRPVVCIGTTSVRTLEGVYQELGRLDAYKGWINIYIRPGFQFKVTDHLLTNFHLPKSSLLIMVSALAGREKILSAYAKALENNFRFFSYGDSMFIR